ncbi:MAG: hypothetical protein JWM80_5727, partial [Cyanobacteria bacterium RYN_339]|nr:hypothetical protein [Cyanobacteria bacterium RYN_339]
VNFDPERSRAMATAIADFARDHQVLFFTCHPAVVTLFQEAGAQPGVVELPRWGGAAAPPAPRTGAEPAGGEDPMGATPLPTGTTRSRLLQALADAVVPLGRRDLLARSGLDESAWGHIRALREEGAVVQLGEKRGATYALAEAGRALLEAGPVDAPVGSMTPVYDAGEVLAPALVDRPTPTLPPDHWASRLADCPPAVALALAYLEQHEAASEGELVTHTGSTRVGRQLANYAESHGDQLPFLVSRDGQADLTVFRRQNVLDAVTRLVPLDTLSPDVMERANRLIGDLAV